MDSGVFFLKFCIVCFTNGTDFPTAFPICCPTKPPPAPYKAPLAVSTKPCQLAKSASVSPAEVVAPNKVPLVKACFAVVPLIPSNLPTAPPAIISVAN